MIYFVGDTHGQFAIFERMLAFIDPTDTVIQVGDFGFNENFMSQIENRWKKMGGYPCPILAIDGNHENYQYLKEIKLFDVNKLSSNIHYVVRGTVLEIEGKLIGFLGGGESLDKAWRETGYSWWPDERITEEDLEKLYRNVNGRQLDVLVTHCPPPQTINENFPPLNKESWSLPKDWKDISSVMVSRAIVALSPTNVVCGHMHKAVKHRNVRILDINEVCSIEQL